MEPAMDEPCECGHTWGAHSGGAIGRCTEKRDAECSCPFWMQPAETSVSEVAASLRGHATRTGNPAAHDAWQLALQHLEPLRAAIARAREAGEGDE